MGDFRVFVLIQMLFIGNIFSEVYRLTEEIYLEGDSCRTPYVDGGKCMNIDLCDPAFLHSLSYDHHISACRHNAKHTVFCCKPYLDYCKTRFPTNFQIANGIEAKPGMFPHLARLGKKNDVIIWRCSANIISVKYLLTAAHCKGGSDVAGVGCNELICKQHITVKNFISHPKYKRMAKYHDIALVELQNNIKFNERVLPICPYAKMDDLPETVDLIIAGWGHDEDFNEPQHLMYATVRTVPKYQCQKEYENHTKVLDMRIVDQQYCAKGSLGNRELTYADACPGDSGGPLQVQVQRYAYLVGVISTGFGCGTELPGLYTRVAAYYDWINTTITASQSIQQT